MAIIKAFSAIRPNAKPLELDLLKVRLEPRLATTTSPSFADCSAFLLSILEEERYVIEEEAIYIYKYQPDQGPSSMGIWTLTSLADVVDKKIIPHEQTLDVLKEQIYAYREQVGLEGAAVLLCYPKDFLLEQLIELATCMVLERRYRYHEVVHRVWKVSKPSLIEGFKLAFSGLSKTYIADGHHRIAAALQLHKKQPQWISSLYMAFEELDIQPFHRLVRGAAIDRKVITLKIDERYSVAKVPENKPYRPDSKGHLGFYCSGIWYKLSPRPDLGELSKLPDANLLQHYILDQALGITDPQNDERLECYANGTDWEQLLLEIRKDESVIVFTLHSLTSAELMACADRGIALPPKSTFFSPKAPFGILMYNEKILGGTEE